MDILSTRQMEKLYLDRARRVGMHIQCENFIEIDPVISSRLRDEMEAYLQRPDLYFIFTSKHAVDTACRFYFARIPNSVRCTWRFFCLSGATKSALLLHFDPRQIVATAPDAMQLSGSIMKHRGPDPIHFFCGNRRRDTLPVFMQKNKLPYKEWQVYQTIGIPQRVERDYDGYIFYSPSAVESFLSLNAIRENRPCFAVGETTGNAIAFRVSNPVIISEYPSTEGIVKELFRHYHIRK